jgi:dTDP-4-dehydrorhamnose reductase
MKILVFGAKGMLGNTLFKYFMSNSKYTVFGTSRKPNDSIENIITGIDILDLESVETAIKKVEPDYILNAVGIIKQKQSTEYESLCIKINSLWPRDLEKLSKKYNYKTIHFSTDCVFTGSKGNYLESDNPDARDVYGLTKYLGEISGEKSLTLRTSIIGHELNSSVSLIDWFLSQENEIKGFSKAIYSGFPTIYIAKFIEKYIFDTKNELSGLYHLSSEAINKYDLLKIVSKVYDKNIVINKDIDFEIDRSLNSERISSELSWKSPNWEELVKLMFEYKEL